MLNPVNHFFVGQAIDLYSIAIGDIALFSPDSHYPLFTGVPTHSGFRVGQIINNIPGDPVGKWRYSSVITPDSIRMAYAMSNPNSELISGDIAVDDIVTPYSAPSLKKIGIDLTDVDVTPITPVGTIVYLELAFKNIRDLSPSFKNYVYSHVCQLAETLESVLDSLCNQVNKDPMINGKISCKYSVLRDPSTGDIGTATITFDAKLPVYHMNQRYEWQSIDFEVSMSYSKPNQITDPDRANWHCDANILNTPVKRIQWGDDPEVAVKGNEGSGYYSIVSDKEKRALAYQGITNWTKFPVELPQLFTKKDAKYCCVQIPFATKYCSADNVEGKLTNEQVTIYLDISTTTYKNNADDLVGLLVDCCNYS